MKTIALIGLIIVAAASAGMAETNMTIQTNTTVRIDPWTGQVKGDAQTEVRGIRKHHEAPQAVNTSPGGPSSADPTAVAAPVNLTTPTDPNTATAPGSVAAPTDQSTVTTPVGATPPANAATTCPLAQVSGGQQN